MSERLHVSNIGKMEVINLMRIMKPALKSNLDLSNLHLTLGGKLYSGRPQMLVITMSNGRKIQIFRGGCIQILGNITDGEAEQMRQEFIQRLSPINEGGQLCDHHHHHSKLHQCLLDVPLRIANIVVCASLERKCCLRQMAHSNNYHFHEMEIFPATLIRKWSPAHVALFHNGKVIITGVKSLSECQKIMSYLSEYLEEI